MSDQGLIDRYIEVDAYGRADARLRGRGVHIWAIIGQLRVHDGNVDDVMADYHISREAVEAAIAYYRENKEYIDARLLLNSA